MDSQNSTLPEELSNFLRQTVTNPHYIHHNCGQKALQRYEELFQWFDFGKHVEEILSEKAKICEDKLKAEQAVATENFLKDAYDNLLNTECPSTCDINDEDAEELRKATEKFLEESYNNLLHMYDDTSETTGEREEGEERRESEVVFEDEKKPSCSGR